MKIALALILVVSAYKTHACDVVGGKRHINPDGTTGGVISSRATVDAKAFISYNAKVCDSAVVESKTQILDTATVAGSAWVRENTVIADRAYVGGKAYLQGSSSGIVYIKDSASISGNAKILYGSHISGKSKIYGSPSLIDSKVGGDSIVCDSFVISEENISSSRYFCGEFITDSRVSMSVANNKLFQRVGDKLILRADPDELAISTSSVSITVNGVTLNPEDYEIDKKTVTIYRNSYFKDGSNTIDFLSRDQFGKKVNDNISFYAGNQNIDLSLAGKPLISEIKLDDGSELYLSLTSSANGLRIENVPLKFLSENVYAIIATQSGVYNYYGPLNEISARLDFLPYSTTINNTNRDFSLGSSAWSLSSADISFSLGSDGSPEISLESTERLFLITSRFRSSSNFLNTWSQEFIQAFDDIEVRTLTFNHDSKAVFLSNSSPVASTALPLNQNLSLTHIFFIQRPTQKTQTLIKPKFVPGNYMRFELVNPVFFNLNPTSIANNLDASFNSFSPLSACNNEIYRVDPKIGLYSPIDNFREVNTYFSRSGRQAQFYQPTLNDELKFLSIGPSPFYNNEFLSRFYANIHLAGYRADDIDWKTLKLVFNSNGKALTEAKLNDCGIQNIINRENLLMREVQVLEAEAHLARFLFYLDQADLKKIEQGYINGKIRAYLVVKAKSGEAVNSINEIQLDPLRSLNFNDSNSSTNELINKYTYGPVDEYSSRLRDTVKTGGDKWVAADLKDLLESWLLTTHNSIDTNWKINDASRINGGFFPIHSSHRNGRIFDLKAGNLNFENNLSPSVSLLHTIMRKANEAQVTKHINRILIHAPPGPSQSFKRLQNTCFEKRLMSFDDLGAQQAFYRHAKGHKDHIHVEFKESWQSPNLAEVPNLPVNITADMFEFGFTSKGSFFIEPIDKELFKDIDLYWRLQSDDSLNPASLVYGKNSEQEEPIIKILGNRYVYVVAVSKTGGCTTLPFSFSFDSEKLCRIGLASERMRYHYNGVTYGLVSTRSTVSSAVNLHKSYICGETTISRGSFSNSSVHGREANIDIFGNGKIENSFLNISGSISGTHQIVGTSLFGNLSMTVGGFITDSYINSLQTNINNFKTGFVRLNGSIFRGNLDITENSNITDSIVIGNLHGKSVGIINSELPSITITAERTILETVSGSAVQISGFNTKISNDGPVRKDVTDLKIHNNLDGNGQYTVSVLNSDIQGADMFAAGSIFLDRSSLIKSKLNAILGAISISCRNLAEGVNIDGPYTDFGCVRE